MTIEQILDAIAPQFENFQNKGDLINIAKLRTSSSQFKDKYNLAVALRAAHNMTLSDTTSTGNIKSGLITSEREGDLSRTYSSTASNMGYSDLMLTGYGQQLYSLIKNNITSITVVL